MRSELWFDGPAASATVRSSVPAGSRRLREESLKALLSPLAGQLLADPSSRELLRQFATSTVVSTQNGAPVQVHVTDNGRTVVYEPVIVKAAA